VTDCLTGRPKNKSDSLTNGFFPILPLVPSLSKKALEKIQVLHKEIPVGTQFRQDPLKIVAPRE